MKRRKLLPAVFLIFGIGVFLVGALLVAAYVSQAVVARIGDPDQSLLFWYSPFLMCGIMGLIAGVGVSLLSFFWLRGAGRAGDDPVIPPVPPKE